MRSKFQWTLTALSLVFLVVAGALQQELNRQRLNPDLGLTRVAPLENAPPVLAFTTVALGSFRGLIANALWIRASQLQEEGKFFEMVQLSDWITKLEPHFSQVWTMQAWNMAYNISVRFSAPVDRWRWVQRGIELLRDQGLQYNPKDPLIYRELAWFFQHKIGYFLDDAHQHYKAMLYLEMNGVLGPAATNITLLATAATDELKQRADYLKSRYKLDPIVMLEVEAKYGRLEWRLAESQAIYWGYLGLKNCKDEPANHETLVTLRRVVYQCLHQLVLRGRVVSFSRDGSPELLPNLDLIPVANQGYLEMMKEEDTWRRGGIETAYRNFLREVVYQLYVNNRKKEAADWFEELRKRFPEHIENAKSMQEYSLFRLKEVIRDRNHQRMKPIILGFLTTGLASEAVDQDEDAKNYENLARGVYDAYQESYGYRAAVRLPEWNEFELDALRQMLHPQTGLYPQLAARLMTKRGIASLTNVFPEGLLNLSTNRVSAGTNTVDHFRTDTVQQPTGP